MQRVTFEIEPRTETGARANSRFRKQGFLPAVIFGHGEKSVATLVSQRDFVQTAKVSRSSQIFTVKSKDGNLDGKIVIVKEIQKDPLNGQVLHIDFQSLKENEAITMRVPLVLKGESVGVKMNGGIMAVLFHDIGIRCLPRNIPESIEVEISALDVGDNVHARDIKLPADVALVDSPDETILSVVIPKAVEEAAPAADAATAEGAAAPAADGTAAPAAAAGAAGAAPKKEGAAAAPKKEGGAAPKK